HVVVSGGEASGGGGGGGGAQQAVAQAGGGERGAGPVEEGHLAPRVGVGGRVLGAGGVGHEAGGPPGAPLLRAAGELGDFRGGDADAMHAGVDLEVDGKGLAGRQGGARRGGQRFHQGERENGGRQRETCQLAGLIRGWQGHEDGQRDAGAAQ